MSASDIIAIVTGFWLLALATGAFVWVVRETRRSR